MKHNLDRYADLDSPLHELDARTKLVMFTALVLAALAIPAGSAVLFFAFFFLTAVLMGISQVPLGYILGRALMPLPIVLLASLAWPRHRGADLAFLSNLTLRATLCLILLVLLMSTTRSMELMRGLRRLGWPPAAVTALAFLYRYVLVMIEESSRLRQARDCRRTRRTSLVVALKLQASLLRTILVLSYERTVGLNQAMLSRGHSGEFPIYGAHRFTWRDLAFAAVVAPFVAAAFLT